MPARGRGGHGGVSRPRAWGCSAGAGLFLVVVEEDVAGLWLFGPWDGPIFLKGVLGECDAWVYMSLCTARFRCKLFGLYGEPLS
jgi:hypothetical protein